MQYNNYVSFDKSEEERKNGDRSIVCSYRNTKYPTLTENWFRHGVVLYLDPRVRHSSGVRFFASGKSPRYCDPDDIIAIEPDKIPNNNNNNNNTNHITCAFRGASVGCISI